MKTHFRLAALLLAYYELDATLDLLCDQDVIYYCRKETGAALTAIYTDLDKRNSDRITAGIPSVYA